LTALVKYVKCRNNGVHRILSLCIRDIDYGDVTRVLRKVIAKDSNVACVAEAVGCVSALATGLRGAYAAAGRAWAEVSRARELDQGLLSSMPPEARECTWLCL
jgi:hypothetical protein